MTASTTNDALLRRCQMRQTRRRQHHPPSVSQQARSTCFHGHKCRVSRFNQAFIAAILTVIGYSLNDTVVVFDRIREFVKEHTKMKLDDTVNFALNNTLSRTLNTSLTTLIVLLAIFFFGGESIRGFMFALIVGVIVGTYSSVFIATPVMYDTQKKSIDQEK